jgi:hypothetical protein
MAAIAAPKISFEILDMISSSAGGQQDDALSSLRRRLDYIAANSITPSRGVTDCGEYREVAGAITPVIASPLSRHSGHSLASLISPMNFFQLGEPHFPEMKFFSTCNVSCSVLARYGHRKRPIDVRCVAAQQHKRQIRGKLGDRGISSPSR